jgi:phosphoenolpyruvate carboxylase
MSLGDYYHQPLPELVEQVEKLRQQMEATRDNAKMCDEVYRDALWALHDRLQRTGKVLAELMAVPLTSEALDGPESPGGASGVSG